VRALHFLGDLVEIQFAESVYTGTDQHHVLMSFNPVQSIQRVIECVEQIRFGESRHAEGVQPGHDCIFVLGEVHYDVRLHVIRNDGHPVVFFERARENVGRLQSILKEPIVGRCELH
jgi:hypothetical protein